MVGELIHQVLIQLERDKKSTNFIKKEISPTSSRKKHYNMKKKLENFIKRDFSVIDKLNQIEELITLKDFPIFMGCTEQEISQDLFFDMKWGIDSKTGIIQLMNLVPLEILYKEQHMDATGSTWDRYNDALANYIVQHNDSINVLEIGGGSGSLARKIKNVDNSISYTIVEPNPIIDDREIKVIDTFFDENISNDNDQTQTVVLSQVLEHAYYPFEFLNTIYNYLPLGGKFIFGYPNLEYFFKNKFTNAINFEHTLLMTDYYLDFILKKSSFKIIDKTNFENHSIFYSVEKTEVDYQEISIENRYDYYKKMFVNFVDHHKKLIKNLNDKIEIHKGPIYLFGAHIFSQYLMAFGLKIDNVVNILDNSKLKQGKRLYGTDLFVKSPKCLKNVDSPLVILKAGPYNDEIKKDILENINSNTKFI